MSSYQLQRKDVAKRLGMTVGAIDKPRKQKQHERAEATVLDVVEPVSPWQEHINAIKMFV